MNSRWCERHDEIVRLHWGKGKTAAEIGEIIGKNKNQVIGRANRLGLQTPRPERIDNHPRTGPTRRNLPVVRANVQRVLNDGTNGCQWLDGEPRERRFCGAPTREDSSYCEAQIFPLTKSAYR